jgi:WD40 repeat protein
LARLLVTNENCQAAFSLDGRWLVTTSSRDFSFWDTQTWQVRRKVPLDLGSAVAGPLAFSRDGRLLAVAANRRDIKLLHPETGAEFATLTAPDSQNLSRVAFSDDGSRLMATTDGRAIQVWDLRTLRHELAGLGLDW